MRYVLSAAARPDAWSRLDEAEQAAWVADDAAFRAELDRRGIAVFGIGLAEADTATTVRLDGQPVLTDGPWADTPEHLDGFLVIEVDDLDAALEVARRCPAARLGPLEVRPARTEARPEQAGRPPRTVWSIG
jgi:hypothetical protein